MRLLALLPVLAMVAGLSFVLVRWAPGGPFDRDRAQASPELERALRARYHLDEPVGRQFGRFLYGLSHGDLGPSLRYRSHAVQEIIAQGVPVSAVLGILAFGASIGFGLPLGLIGAVWRGGALDGASSLVAFLALCIPAFVVGPLLILLLAVHWEWFPVALWAGPSHWVLPVATLALFYGGRVARLVREGMTDALQSGCIRTARAKGAGEISVLLRHALPMGILPLVTYSGPLLADLLTGSFVVENLFQLPGLGTLTVNSALNRDYPLIVGLVLVYAALLLLLNMVADLAHAWIDPRVRHE
jgi:oligopeptide transport system permease protein